MSTAVAAGSAHLTGTTNVSRPSVFELLSHEGFAKALKPAVFHVIKVLTEQDPRGWLPVTYRYFDELYLVFDAIVQWHYILTRGATLSESFYGLERKLITKENKLIRARISYLASIFVPYVASKLDTLYKSQIENDATSNGGNQTDAVSHSHLFIQWYPRIKLMFRAINVYYLLAYTFGRSEYHNITFKLLKMTLAYTSEERNKFMEEKNAELWMTAQWRDPRKFPTLMLRALGESVLFAVEIGTFFIQFLQWWYDDDKRARITVNSGPTPPAPQTFAGSHKVRNLVELLPSDMNKCPLCRKEFRNPTVLSVSGVVYCYGCIFPRISGHGGTCPLTSLPCNINNMIRIYP